jgi:hypothetical protein
MSYTEYMRRAAASSIKVVNTRENTDASMHTVKVRMSAAQDFAANGGRYGVVNTPGDSSMAPLHQVNSYQKNAGGPTPDASTFTTYRGGQAIGEATQAGLKPAQVQVGTCYTITPTTPALSSSDFTRVGLACQKANGQPHNADTVGPALFVDNTIRNQGDPGLCTTRAANHTHPADVPHNPNHARPILTDKGNLAPGKEVGAFGGTDHYKPGAALRRPQNYQIFKKDTNVGTTSAKPVPTKYQIPANTPAHLKINDPHVG